MSDVIDFLEKLGQDSTLRHATGAQLQGAMSDLDPQLRAALMAGDRQTIEALLGTDNVCCLVNAPMQGDEADPGKRNVCCMIFAPLQEEEEGDAQLRRSA
jgi:hypothetical protein